MSFAPKFFVRSLEHFARSVVILKCRDKNNNLLRKEGDAAGEFLPRVDVSETGKEVRITAELPGLDEKDMEVAVTNNMLTIKGEKKVEEEEGDYYHSERSYGYFNRTIALPQGIDADKAEAKFKKGVLKVTIPKKPEAQSWRRKIELTEG